MLLSWNNVAYYESLMRDIRAAIENGRFADRSAEISEAWERGDLPPV
jgi:queuine tRNA-ribosyltransferase